MNNFVDEEFNAEKFEFQSLKMEIHEPKVTSQMQKQQNLGKFPIFDVSVQL
jgi:hypothetical protein